MAERGIGVGRGVLWFGRVLPDGTVHLEQLFGLGVERLEIVIAERPRWGNAVMMGRFFEVAAAERGRQAPYILVLPPTQ